MSETARSRPSFERARLLPPGRQSPATARQADHWSEGTAGASARISPTLGLTAFLSCARDSSHAEMKAALRAARSPTGRQLVLQRHALLLGCAVRRRFYGLGSFSLPDGHHGVKGSGASFSPRLLQAVQRKWPGRSPPQPQRTLGTGDLPWPFPVFPSHFHQPAKLLCTQHKNLWITCL